MKGDDKVKKSTLIIICTFCVVLSVIGFNYIRNIMRDASITVLNEKQVEAYNKYKLSISSNTLKDDILNLCEKLDVEVVGDIGIQKFSSQEVVDYLYNCKELTSIEVLHDNVYVFYTTNDNLKVYLGYSNTGFVSLDISDEIKDTLVRITENKGLLYQNFSKDESEPDHL
ncbi:hypothetical protein DSECCO2_364200 [anaerobic digester metagenome]